MKSSTRALAGALGASAAAAAIGGVGSRRAPQVYATLEKPPWAPPAAVFGPVWTALYASMGVAAWRLAQRPARRPVLILHGAQLVLNAAWPSVFFAKRSRGASLAIIAGLDLLVAAEVAMAARRDRLAAGLLAPYLAWCLYATALNAAVSQPGNQP